ncbi:MAG: S41 family peptidase [Flavobacterium sp.]
MKQIFTLILVLISKSIFGQECKCENELKFVINYYEENLPAYTIDVNKSNINWYNQFKIDLLKESKNKCNKETDCYKIILTYVEFFKDNHSSIYQNSSIKIDESKPEEVEKFLNSDTFKDREFFENFKIEENNSLNEIVNTFQMNDNTYTVAIVKSKTNFRDFAGIIIDSKTPLWKKGQVKFELKEKSKNVFDMFLYMRNHSLEYKKNITLKNGILSHDWFNVKLKEKKSYNVITPGNRKEFKELTNDVNYLHIGTFNGQYTKEINDFYKKHDSVIQSKPFLIIDVRNNSGGSDDNSEFLMKYIYTKPYFGTKIEIYSTKENIRKNEVFYQMMLKDSLNWSKEWRTTIFNEIETMKKTPNQSFIPRGSAEKYVLENLPKNPIKVIIITNKFCGSACETLVYRGLDSKKTIVVGENTYGSLGYGENTKINTPNFNFELYSTMTKNNKLPYEVVGIPPKYYLTNEKDWVEQALELIKK